MIRVDIQLPPGIQNLRASANLGFQKGLTRSVGLVTNSAIRNSPKAVTGNLRRSIQAKPVEGIGGRFLGEVVQDTKVAKYGPFVEYGTGIYGPKKEPIKPVNAKMLAWKGPDGMIYRRSVKGMKPRPYMRPALNDNIENIKVIMQDEINKAVK